MVEHLLEGLNDDGALRRKHLFQLGELASAMRQTVAADQCPFIRGIITGERIRHHQWLVSVCLPVGQQRLQVLPRMGAPGKIQADRVLTLLDDQAVVYIPVRSSDVSSAWVRRFSAISDKIRTCVSSW